MFSGDIPTIDLAPTSSPVEVTDIEPYIETESVSAGYQPTDAMAENAQKALEIRRIKPMSERGMTSVGIARARDISNRVELSQDTVKRMLSFFARHEIDKKGSTWDEKGKGWQAWNGWGGDEGYAWAKKILNAQRND